MVEIDRIQERAKQIYQTVFAPVFSATCGRPLSKEQVNTAFSNALGDKYTADMHQDVDDFYLLADVNNDAELSKDEIRNFLVDSLKRNKFEELFAAENEEMEKLVNQIYDYLFADLFKSDEQETIQLWEYE